MPSSTRGCLPWPIRRRARQAQAVGSTQEKLPSAHGQPMQRSSMSLLSFVLAVRLLSLACQQRGRRLLKRSLLVAERRLGEENQRRRPDRFRPAAFETIRPLAESALTQPVAAGLDGGGKEIGMTRQSKKGEAGRFQMGGLIGSVAPSAARTRLRRQIIERIVHGKNPPEKGRRHPVEV